MSPSHPYDQNRGETPRGSDPNARGSAPNAGGSAPNAGGSAPNAGGGDPNAGRYDPGPNAGQYGPGPTAGRYDTGPTGGGYYPNAGDPNAGDPNAGDPNAGDPNAGDPNRPDPRAADPDYGAPRTQTDRPVIESDRHTVMANQKEQYGGVKIGSALLGWVTAVGAIVILAAIATVIAAIFNIGATINTSSSSADLANLGLGAGIVALVIFFLAYVIGGYVAGRMARFNGVRQGVAVWVWGVVIAIIVTVIGLIAGQNSSLSTDVNLPGAPVNGNNLTGTGWIVLAIVLVVTLVGAILGGLAGMRYHRAVDRAGFSPPEE